MKCSVGLFTVFLQVILVLSVGCSQESAESKKIHHRERAAQYFEKGDYRAAVIEFKNLTRLDPLDADAHYHQGLAHLKLGSREDLQEALKVLSTAVELDAKNLDAQVKLGHLYLMANKPTDARKRADIVLTSAPDHKDGHVLRGLGLVGESRFADGIAELKKAVGLDPTNVTVWIALARAQMQGKDVKGAETTLLDAQKANPQSLEVRLALGDFYHVTERHEQAEGEFKRAVTDYPDRPESHTKLASFYLLKNRLSDAEAVYRNWAGAKPNDASPFVALGDFYRLTGQLEKASANYQQALTINPQFTVARDRQVVLNIDTNKLDEAERQTKAILEANPKDPNGLLFDGRLKLARDQLDAAATALQSLKTLEPQAAAAHHYLGLVFVKKNDLPQAVIELKEAIRLAPGSVDSHAALAGVYLSQGATDLAIEQAQATLRLNPRHLRITTVLGEAYLRKGDTDKAKQVFQALAKAMPNDSAVSHRLGLIARAEKKDTEALQHFEQALALKPDLTDALAHITAIKVGQGKPEEARTRLLHHQNLAPKNARVQILLGQLAASRKDYDQAEAAFKQAIEWDDALLESYTGLADVYLKRGKTDEAIKEYQIVLSKNPKHLGAHMVLGMIYDSQKQYEKAKASYEEALKINSRFGPAANNLAWLLMEHGGNSDVALGYAQTAREVMPHDPSIADTIGWIYYQKNVFLQAAALLKEAAEKLPNEPLVQFHYGMALYKNGNKSEAKKALERSLQLNANHLGAAEAKSTLATLASS